VNRGFLHAAGYRPVQPWHVVTAESVESGERYVGFVATERMPAGRLRFLSDLLLHLLGRRR
jgi:hypothetical protein